jgi:L-asparaginase
MKPQPSSHILLLHTGGTLGMAPSGTPSSLSPGPFLDHLLERLPELRELAQLRLEVPFNCDSAALEPERILGLARIIRDQSAEVDGVVLIHGTDTMAFTASVLGFLLADLGKPVVLTGSQRPLAYVRSDARSNLINAVDLATRGVPEVGICFGSHWLRGVAADKMSVHRFEAFGSPNLPPLAEIGMDVVIHEDAGRFDRRVPPGLGEALDMGIQSYRPHPGMNWSLPPEGTRALLIEAYGAGNLPMERPDLQALLRHAQARELPVVVVTQCFSGGVNLEAYALGRASVELGAISGSGHTRWTALAKLGLLLGAGRGLAEIRAAFMTAWAGEPL